MPRSDQRLELERLQKKYSQTVPHVRTARNIAMLVDTVVRDRIFHSPRLDYRQALTEVFEDDPELKRAYAES